MAGGHALLNDAGDVTDRSGTVVGLVAFLEDVRDTNVLLAFMDGANEDLGLDESGLGLGLSINIDGTGQVNGEGVRGGGILLKTGTTGDSQATIQTEDGVATGDRNAHFTAILTSRAAAAALVAQVWGFSDSSTVSLASGTTQHKAFFRSVTTGALFAVTGNGGGEETTSLSGSHTLGAAGVFEVFTTDDGVTWIFHIAKTQVASHTTTVPTVSTLMRVFIGIENNTTTDLQITDCDLIYAHQDRT